MSDWWYCAYVPGSADNVDIRVDGICGGVVRKQFAAFADVHSVVAGFEIHAGNVALAGSAGGGIVHNDIAARRI